MVEPSAIGSENGTPISTTSQTDATSARLRLKSARVGNPAVRNPTRAGRPCATAAPIAAEMRSCAGMGFEQRSLQDAHVLIASARTADQNPRARVSTRVLARAENRVRRLDRGQDALAARALGERIERLLVRCALIARAAALFEIGMLRTHARVIEPGGYRMRLAYLAEGILQDQRVAALQYARRPERERCRVVAESRTSASRLDAQQLDFGIVDKRMEQADGIRAAAHASDRDVRQSAGERQHLRARLAADHRLQLAHEIRIGVRPDGGAETIKRAVRIGHPIA